MIIVAVCRPCIRQALCLRRPFSCATAFRAGHNRWSKIRHDKGRNDALKSKARSFLSKDVEMASKFGGPDPAFNPRLAVAIANAKKGSMSKPSIESAIARGQGKTTTGAPLEPLLIEAMLRFSVGAVIEVRTDQKIKALQEFRLSISRHGGTISPTSFLFERKGQLVLAKAEGQFGSSEEVLEHVLDAGALELESDDQGKLIIDTVPDQLSAVADQLSQSLKCTVHSTSIVLVPSQHSIVYLEPAQMKEIESFVEQIEEDSRVEAVYFNAQRMS